MSALLRALEGTRRLTVAACVVVVGVACLSNTLQERRGVELVGFPDPAGTRRAWRQKEALDAHEYRSDASRMSDRALTQPLKRAGPLDAERQAEHDMYYRAIRRPNWQSKQGQVGCQLSSASACVR